ncbi:MAG: hypothetical protein ACYCQJ_15880 [Nitrososphaerales archaeon]
MTESLIFTGVQPYIRIGPTVFLLLGKERWYRSLEYKDVWSGFGGRPKKRLTINDDIEEIKKEAAREFYEETFGILGTAEEIVPQLDQYFHEGRSISFLLELDIPCPEQLVENFNRVSEYWGACQGWNPKRKRYELLGPCSEYSLEKSEIAFVPTHELHTIKLSPVYQNLEPMLQMIL